MFVGSQNVPLAKQELSYRQEKASSAADTCLADSDSSQHDSDHGNVCPSVLVNRCIGLFVKLAVVISSGSVLQEFTSAESANCCVQLHHNIFILPILSCDFDPSNLT